MDGACSQTKDGRDRRSFSFGRMIEVLHDPVAGMILLTMMGLVEDQQRYGLEIHIAIVESIGENLVSTHHDGDAGQNMFPDPQAFPVIYIVFAGQ